MVPGVERFGADVDFRALGDFEVLAERKILLDLFRAEHAVIGVGAELVVGRIFEWLAVADSSNEPLVAIVLGAGVWIAGTLDGTPVGTRVGPQGAARECADVRRERAPAVDRQDAAEIPAANGEVCPATDVMAVMPVAAEGNLPNIGEVKRLPCDAVAVAPAERAIVQIRPAVGVAGCHLE